MNVVDIELRLKKVVAAAEKFWRSVHIFRLAGIYGQTVMPLKPSGQGGRAEFSSEGRCLAEFTLMISHKRLLRPLRAQILAESTTFVIMKLLHLKM